jgi:hypothetical protein
MTKHIEKNTATQVNSERIGVQVSPDAIPETSKIDVLFGGEGSEIVKISTSFDGVHYMLSTKDGDVYYNGANEMEIGGEKYVELIAYGSATYATLWAKRNSFFEIRRNDNLYEITGNPGEEVVTQVAKVNRPFGDIKTGYAFVAGAFEDGYYIADANGFINSDKTLYISEFNKNDVRAVVIGTIHDASVVVNMYKTSDSYDETHKIYRGAFPAVLFPGEENTLGQYSGIALDFSVLNTEGHPAVDDTDVTYIAHVYETQRDTDLTGSVTATYKAPFKTITADLNCWYVEVSDRVMIDGEERILTCATFNDLEGYSYLYQNGVTMEFDGELYYQYAKYAGNGPDVCWASNPIETLSDEDFYKYNGESIHSIGTNQGKFTNIPSPNSGFIIGSYGEEFYSSLGNIVYIGDKLFLKNTPGDVMANAVVSVSNPNYLISNAIFNYNPVYDRVGYTEVQCENYMFEVDTTEGHPVVGDVMENSYDQIPSTATIKSIVYGDPDEVSCQVSYSVRGDNFTEVGDPLTDENNVINNIPRYVYLKFSQDVDITEE